MSGQIHIDATDAELWMVRYEWSDNHGDRHASARCFKTRKGCMGFIQKTRNMRSQRGLGDPMTFTLFHTPFVWTEQPIGDVTL